MSSIKVWTSDGNWSEPVTGCDKIHLMKKAIVRERSIAHHDCKGDRSILSAYEELMYRCPDGGEVRHSKYGLQVNNKEITLSRWIDSEWSIDFEEMDLLNAIFFKMRLSTLREMAEKEETMSVVYNKLIHLAKVPEKVSEGYCLFFMFSDE